MSPTKKKLMTPFATAFAVALAGCATMPSDSPQLSSLQAELKTAYGDRYAAEYGHADLAKAETSLAEARSAMQKGHVAETQHDLAMAESYITLGNIHGQQERTKAETVALKERQDKLRLAARDRDVLQANDRAEVSRVEAVTANADAQYANDRAEASRADAVTANAAAQDAQAAQQTAEAKATAMRDQLRVYNLKITELGATLVLRDVIFDTDSADLKAGAVNRLKPLISFLQANPATSVRIEGNTDNSGSVEHNNELSLNRANSVKQALLSGGALSNAIATFGNGESKPIATNATVSGREENRRVEVTLQ